MLDKPFHQDYTSIYLDYRKGRKIRIRIGTENTTEFKALAKKYFDDEHSLRESEFVNFNKIIAQASAINENFRCYPDALAHVLEQRENQRRSALVFEKYEPLFKKMKPMAKPI